MLISYENKIINMENVSLVSKIIEYNEYVIIFYHTCYVDNLEELDRTFFIFEYEKERDEYFDKILRSYETGQKVCYLD